MKLCRFDQDRIGTVDGDHVYDVTEMVRDALHISWPPPYEDTLIARLHQVRPLMENARATATRIPLSEVRLLSPVARPTKIIAAPVNYKDHLAESIDDPAIHYGSKVKEIMAAGLFLKSPTSLIGPSEPVRIRFPERRNDHEIELGVIIGRKAERVSRAEALHYVAGYTIALDMTVRGPEDRSFRKSPDSYTVLGPWMISADEFGDPGAVGLSLKVNGETRQNANTRDLILDVPDLIAFATTWYSLSPGDVLITGTPAGVGPVLSGDIIHAEIERIGQMQVHVV